MARIFVDGFELPNVDSYEIKLINSQTDLNSLRTKLAKTNGQIPSNSPSMNFESKWAIYLTLEINYDTRIQLAFDSRGRIQYRGKGGSNSTPSGWTSWKQIC